MYNYFDKMNPMVRDYFNILSEEFPDFLYDYINTDRMLKQDNISVSCGTYYSNMFDNLWYSSLDHSIGVALITWNFTHDKKQTLAGLFHDISTPVFKHSIDFMNGDSETQESTEDLTKDMILNSKEIMDLLKRDNIDIDEVCDYHIYSICDNDIPKLSADRLEYTLSNGLGIIKKIWNLDDIKRIYNNICIVKNEDKIDEMCFKDKDIAEEFVKGMSELSLLYMDDKRRFSMEFLAHTIKLMIEDNILTIENLYNLSEDEVINKIKNCDKYNISNSFKIWQEGIDVNTSDNYVEDKYNVKVNGKKRYIDPLVIDNNQINRISSISSNSYNNINKVLDYSFDRYVYMDFDFDNKDKILIKK